jgi:hypothetical protein
MATFQLHFRNAAIAGTEKSVKNTVATKGQVSIPVKQSSGPVPVPDSKIAADKSPASKQTAVDENSSGSAGIVSHVVISYNQHGKLRTKFVDSRNNVVYQIPSEMITKLEDQMLTSNTSTNVKA